MSTWGAGKGREERAGNISIKDGMVQDRGYKTDQENNVGQQWTQPHAGKADGVHDTSLTIHCCLSMEALTSVPVCNYGRQHELVLQYSPLRPEARPHSGGRPRTSPGHTGCCKPGSPSAPAAQSPGGDRDTKTDMHRAQQDILRPVTPHGPSDLIPNSSCQD
jgi:hypothetical protein